MFSFIIVLKDLVYMKAEVQLADAEHSSIFILTLQQSLCSLFVSFLSGSLPVRMIFLGNGSHRHRSDCKGGHLCLGTLHKDYLVQGCDSGTIIP